MLRLYGHIDAATGLLLENGLEVYSLDACLCKGAAQEVNTIAQAGISIGERVAKGVDKHLLKPLPLDKSLVMRGFNKRGVALVAAGSMMLQGARDTKQYIQDRQGSNDGRLYRPTPQMSTPYQLSEQMAYSSHGQSYADNAGATGDLVFALNNSRHG